MKTNLPEIRQIPGLSQQNAETVHDALSWLEATPNLLEVSEQAHEIFHQLTTALCSLSALAAPISAEMDDLGKAAIVWEDEDGHKWLHLL